MIDPTVRFSSILIQKVAQPCEILSTNWCARRASKAFPKLMGANGA